MEKNQTLLDELKKKAKDWGLSEDEIEKRYRDFFERIPELTISEEELKKRTEDFLSTLPKSKKKKYPLKVTISLDTKNIDSFNTIKNKLGVKSNADVFRKLLEHAVSKQEQLSMERIRVPSEKRIFDVQSFPKPSYLQISVTNIDDLIRISEIRSLPVLCYSSEKPSQQKSYYVVDGVHSIIYSFQEKK